jgi:hypothetical protein
MWSKSQSLSAKAAFWPFLTKLGRIYGGFKFKELCDALFVH